MTISRNLSFLAEGVSSTGVLGASNGGTGQNTVTTGDLLYGSATNTWSKLSIGSTGTILRVVGGIPSWGTDYTGTVTSVAASVPSFLSISGSPITTSGTLAITYSGTALPVANGGTGLTTYTAGDLPYYASGTALSKLGIGTSGYILSSSGTAPQWVNSISIGSGTFTSVTDSGLTAGRVNYNGTGGLLVDSANLTFDGTNLGIGLTPTSAKGNLQVNTAISYTDTGILATFASSVAGYNQIILQNTNSGATASTNFNVSNNNGTATTNFGEFGINSSAFTGSGSFNQAGYTYLASGSTDLAIGTYGSNAIHFVINSGATDAMTIDTNGRLGIGTSSPTAQLTVANDASISGLTIGKGGGSVATNTVLGNSALSNSSNTGDKNTALGNNALNANTTGYLQTAIGYAALYVNTTGNQNIAVGAQSLFANTNGLNNVSVGVYSLLSNTTGGSNTAIGTQALNGNTTASNNTAVGYQAGYNNTTGANNTFIGYTAGTAVTTGSNLIVIGYTATASSITATNEITIGNSSVTVTRLGGTTVVASLPSAATVGAGARSFVTNSLSPTFGTTVVGGGTVSVPVYSDGTNWKVG
jgi:hypothetical protein